MNRSHAQYTGLQGKTMIDLEREGDVFILTMNDDENLWNTTFVNAFSGALNEVEKSEGPAALLTASASEKFFSNGLDLEWFGSQGEHRGGDRSVFTKAFMGLMARIITFPIPTVAAINGHAFGAGFMLALCHDVRFMRADRGYACAPEMELGMGIPTPELALFRHKIPMNAFFETVQLGRRWTGADALAAGVVQGICELPELRETALHRAQELSRLGANRKAYGQMKEQIYGKNSAINDSHGPAYLLRHPEKYQH
jgi:enoyl-CoA hydratase/carnithine racemase